MISLVTAGLLDTSFLVPLQVFQTWLLVLVKATIISEWGDRQLEWVPDKEAFVYTCESVVV
jgi:hypothetical protein